MKKLEQMSFSDLKILHEMAEKEWNSWQKTETQNLTKNDLEIARQQSEAFFLFKYHILEALRKKMYTLLENYNKLP